MGLFSGLVSSLFGGPPDLEPWQPVNAQGEQQTAIAGNISALPQSQKLASRTNTFAQSEIQRMLELAMPGYVKLRDKGTEAISSLVAGEIPKDVQSAVTRNAAARSLYGGYGGSGMARNLTARDLGLTSLDLMSKGLDSATKWISQSRTLAPTMDVTSMFLSPAQQVNFAASERDKRLNYTNTKNQFEYANDPVRGVEGFLGGVGDMFGTALMGYLGGGSKEGDIAKLASQTQYMSPWG